MIWKTIFRMAKEVLGWAGAFSAVFIVGFVVWAYTDTTPPIKVAGPSYVINPDVPRGGILRVVRTLDRQRFCPGRVGRYYIDSIGIPYIVESFDFPEPAPEEQARIIREQVKKVTVEIPVPKGITPGAARYQGRILYYCNPLQRVLDKPIIVTTEEIKFNVLPEDVTSIQPPKRNNKRTSDFPAIQNRQFEAP